MLFRHLRRWRESSTNWITVPEAFRCFYEAIDFEDAIRNAISIGGDSDTLAAIPGSIARQVAFQSADLTFL